MKTTLSFTWLFYTTSKGKFSKLGRLIALLNKFYCFVLFIMLLPLVYDLVSTLPKAIFLNKLVFQSDFYDLMISSSGREVLI